MKKSFYSILCVIILTLISQEITASQSSTMKFDYQQWDFGTINEIDGEVSHTFKFTNTGQEPFVIENVSTTCGCTTPEYTRRPIRPGQQGEVKITYNPAGRPGRFSREVLIISNNKQNRNVLTIKGVVNPRPRSIEDDYPYQIIENLRLNTLSTNFRYVEHNDNRSMVIGFVNPTDEPMSIAIDQMSGSPYLSVVANPAVVGPKEHGSLTLTYFVEDTTVWGRISNSFKVVVNGKVNQVPISTTAVVVEQFKALSHYTKKNSPTMELSTSFIDLGQLKGKVSKKVTITNSGKNVLHIRDISLPQGVECGIQSPISLQPQQSITMTLSITGDMIDESHFEREVIFIVNIPTRPMRKIRIIGYK